MKCYFDPDANCLVYAGKESNKQFWDDHWSSNLLQKRTNYREKGILSAVRKILGGSYVIRLTKRFLPPGSTVLEGGCGLANHVRDLTDAGFHAIGVDYAPETVIMVKEAFPGLDIRLGDVRKLPFKDNELYGYWSLGVIEHFWEGYDPIVREMVRSIRGGGYLFLTFPHMSWLRKKKARWNCYENIERKCLPPDGFYQFALDPASVIKTLNEYGFQLVLHRGIAGLKGLKDEVTLLKPFLQKLYNASHPLAKIIKRLLESLLNPWTGHSSLLIFKIDKNNEYPRFVTNDE
jgi:SAM-dependent methyltransferase